MKLTLIRVLIFLLLSSPNICAESIIIRKFSELIEPSHLIARVIIVSVREANSKTGYRKVAQARVIDSLKGLAKGATFELEYDTGASCPNVFYDAGEDVLLFAKKLGNGRYETSYANAGKFSILYERVSKHPFVKNQSYKSAAAKIRSLL